MSKIFFFEKDGEEWFYLERASMACRNAVPFVFEGPATERHKKEYSSLYKESKKDQEAKAKALEGEKVPALPMPESLPPVSEPPSPAELQEEVKGESEPVPAEPVAPADAAELLEKVVEAVSEVAEVVEVIESGVEEVKPEAA